MQSGDALSTDRCIDRPLWECPLQSVSPGLRKETVKHSAHFNLFSVRSCSGTLYLFYGSEPHKTIYKFIWRVWPWTSSVQILPVPLLALSVVKSHMYVPIPGFVPYAGWIFHQRRQQRLGPAERVSKTKPHRCVNKLRGSIMHHPLLFLTQHPSSQHNTEERESRFPWAVRRQRLTVCESVSVCV